MSPKTSIGFGAGEVIEVALSLEDVRTVLQDARANRTLVEFQAINGEKVIINPEQVKVLQNSGPPQRFDAERSPEDSATS